MSKSKKIVLLIFCILILTIFLPILIDYHQVSDLGIQLTSWRQTSFEYYIARYVFWGLLGLSIFVLLWMLVILFYPRQYLEIKLGTKDDKLKLKKFSYWRVCSMFIGWTQDGQKSQNSGTYSEKEMFRLCRRYSMFFQITLLTNLK